MNPVKPWSFTGSDGSFHLEDPHKTSYLYFPLVNEAGLMSAVTPDLHGDAKADQHTFLLAPESLEDLHNSRSARNFWLYAEEAKTAWSVTGNSAAQISATDPEKVSLDAGFLWHTLTRENAKLGLRAVVTSIVPASPDQVELTKVVITNISNHALTITPTAALPLYGRSADNLRDHRNVTSLLHRARCTKFGVQVRPVMAFDERGHHPNAITYTAIGAEGDGCPPVGFFPAVEDFIGEGGTLDWPAAVVQPIRECQPAGTTLDGYETIGALRFKQVSLVPGESRSYVLAMAVLQPETNQAEDHLVKTYLSDAQFAAHLDATKAFWTAQLSTFGAQTGDPQFDMWLKWVAVQPILRRLYGCSFLPAHDYGRGGRGWRDLWQDILALMLMETGPVDQLLFSNFAGIRLDGSNATIIGSRPGEFKADRNNIPRVWMDHGLWPLMTTSLYIDQSGDLNFLLRQAAYFKDSHTHRCQQTDFAWTAASGTIQQIQGGEIFEGTVLEHFLIQHLTAFFHVGEHNNILLEGADWNDGMDMAHHRGESVAFTQFYAANLRQLSQLAKDLQASGIEEVDLLQELLPLLDTLGNPVDYENIPAKQGRLAHYFNQVAGTISGKKIRVSLNALAADLQVKADWLMAHLRAQEYIQNAEGYHWFNGYYNDDGERLEGDHPQGMRMTLSGQVFALMGGIATDEQAREVLRAADHYLFDDKVGGYRLNTNFHELLLNMGRCFGYAYGHKENGAMFSHMAVMFAYALYQRGFTQEAFKALNAIYAQSANFAVSRMYPGIPEYFSERGRGMYPYLTGSASWYLLTIITQVFGVRGNRGNLTLAPMLLKEQFDQQGDAALTTLFAGRKLRVAYHNPHGLEYGSYNIQKVTINGKEISGEGAKEVILPRKLITDLPAGELHQIDVTLG